jgi:hypothetical protein
VCYFSLLSKKGKEYPLPNADHLADFAGRFPGMLIEHFGMFQFHNICTRPPSGLPSRLCRGSTGGGALSTQLPFHLMDSAHHGQEATAGGGAGIYILAQRHQVDLLLLCSYRGYTNKSWQQATGMLSRFSGEFRRLPGETLI